VGLFDDILGENKRPDETPRPQGLFDDIVGAEEQPQAKTPQEATPVAPQKAVGIFDDIVGSDEVGGQIRPMTEYAEAPSNNSSFAGALGRGAARSAIPTGAGIVGGALTGAAIGAVMTGPAAPVGAAIGGLAGGVLASMGAEALQEYGMDKMLSPETKSAIDDQFRKDAKQQPVASFVGQVAPSVAFFRPSPSNLAKAGTFAKQIISGEITKDAMENPAVREQASNLLNVAFNTGTQGGMEAFNQFQQGDFNPLRLGASLVVGALNTEPTKLGKMATAPSERLVEAIQTRGNVGDVAPQAEGIQPEAQENVPAQPQESETPETIRYASILTPKGTVYSGRWHPAAFEEYAKDLGKTLQEAVAEKLFEGVESGFVTSNGRFVSREEAAVIAEKANQYKKEEEGGYVAPSATPRSPTLYAERISMTPDRDYSLTREAEPASSTARANLVMSPFKKGRLTRLDQTEGELQMKIDEETRKFNQDEPSNPAYYEERLAEVRALKDRLLKSEERPTKAFDEEMIQPSENGYDIVDFIQEQGGMLSKGRAIRDKNIDLYGKKGGPSVKRLVDAKPPAEYDGMPILNGPYKKLLSGTTPVDEIAQSAFDQLGIGDGTSGSLWGAIESAIKSRKRSLETDKEIKANDSQRQAFSSAILKPKEGQTSYKTSDLQIGDTITSGKDIFKVSEIDPETYSRTLDGPQGFGTRTIKEDSIIFADSAENVNGDFLRGVKVRNARVSATKPQMTLDQKIALYRQEGTGKTNARPSLGERVQGVKNALSERLNDFRRTFQDKFVDVENLQNKVSAKNGSPIAENENIKQREELYHGRVGERVSDFEDTKVSPLLDELRKSGVDRKDFELYAQAKHGRERNTVIAQRDVNKPDGGSGLTNAEISTLIDGNNPTIPKADQRKMEPIRQKLIAINKQTLRNLWEGGLISGETYDLLSNRFTDYVPLVGKAGGTDVETEGTLGTGAGYDVRGNDIKIAEGRTTIAPDPLAYSLQLHRDSIIRSEKNRVMQTAAQFAIKNRDNGIIQVLEKGEIGNANDKDTIAYKENGETKYLRINDPKLADVMKNRASVTTGPIIQFLSTMNRWFAYVNTQASPEFVIANFARDLQTALINISGESSKGLATGLIKSVPDAMRATYRAEMGKPDMNGKMDVYYKEFKEAGGRMTFFGLKDVAATQKDIQNALGDGSYRSAKKVFRVAMDKLARLNSAVENATRLATYSTLRDNGYSVQKAAYASRNITVNFTRKGTAGPLLNSIYLFANANIQGTARIFQAVATSPKVRKILTGVMVAGYFRSMVNRIVGGEDESGEAYYDKIPQYVKETNFIIMKPDSKGQYFKIPMPYGYSVADYTGQLLSEVSPKEAFGAGASKSRALAKLAGAMLDNFNPLGASKSLLQTISPTIITPITDYALNMDYSGRPIMPTPSPFDATPPPNSQRYWSNVGGIAKSVSQKINELTGGNEVRAGAIDISPETLGQVYDFFTGSAGKFVERLATLPRTALKASQGEMNWADVVGEIPMTRKVYGAVPSYVDTIRYQDLRKEILTVSDEFKLAQTTKDTKRLSEIRSSASSELKMVEMVKHTEQSLKELRTERTRLKSVLEKSDNPAIQKRIDKNNETQKALMMRALKRYNTLLDDKV